VKILIVGSGGREHALAWKLSQEAEVVAAPGNPGIADCARCVPIPATDQLGIADLAAAEAADLVVVGPEDPLIAGLADALRSRGIPVFGPGAEGARLEGSKAYSKQLMREAGVRTAFFEVFDDAAKAHAYVDSCPGKVVVKASGAALGKGVIVTETKDEAHEAVEAMLVDGEFGAAGKTIVIEQRLVGPEFSLLTLCSGPHPASPCSAAQRGRGGGQGGGSEPRSHSSVPSQSSGNPAISSSDSSTPALLSLPIAQDFKRALDGDRGPNTGGMGSYSPVSRISPKMVRQTEADVVEPVLAALRAKGIDYRGVLYSGLLQHDGESYCLEFNVRFGDPEIQSIVLRLGSGFAAALLACAKGEPIPPVEVLDNAAVSVVVASGGYPGSYEKGKPIEIGPLPAGVQVFHAGTATNGGRLVTNGGRVLAVSACARSVAEARQLAYEGVRAIKLEGMQLRSDIAAGT